MMDEQTRKSACAMAALAALKFYEACFPSDDEPWHAVAAILSDDMTAERRASLEAMIDERIEKVDVTIEAFQLADGHIVAAMHALKCLRAALAEDADPEHVHQHFKDARSLSRFQD